MDMWAPSQSRVELPGDLMQLALEPAQTAAEGPPAGLLPQQAALDQGEEGGRDLLGSPSAARVVPLVHPVDHPENREDHQARPHVAERAGANPLGYYALHFHVTAVLLGREVAREAGGQGCLFAEE